MTRLCSEGKGLVRTSRIAYPSCRWLLSGTLLALLLFARFAAAFEPARPGYDYAFPRDHFRHPEFQTEWWYYTGNLVTAESRRFGFELTFFRVGVERETPPESKWDIRDLYLAHLTLSDIETGKFYKAERLSRSGPGLAGADADTARIWNGNWQVRWLELGRPEEHQKLDAVAENFSLELSLNSAKAPVIHGREGISRKSAQEGAASHYISLTRLNVSGSVRLNGQDHRVRGSAWMDHEFFTHEMDSAQAGWDWMSIQLDDETDLMLYRMRRNDGSADPHSSGTLVDAEGRVTHLDAADIVMQPGKTWSSPDTGGRYPIEWKVSVPKLGISLDCRTPLLTQEVVSPRQIGPNYWEGAVDYEGVFGGKSVKGVGYLEMTGYDKRLVLSETIN